MSNGNSLVVGFDLETTGIDPKDGHRIIEVGMVFCDVESQEVVFRYEQRVKPSRSIDAKAVAVHGITLDMLKDEPDWTQVGPKVKMLFDKASIAVAHNGVDFDMPFVKHELAEIGLGLNESKLKVVDTMLESRWATFSGKNPNLGELCLAMNVEYDPAKAHSAIYDVDVMMKCYFIGIAKGYYQ